MNSSSVNRRISGAGRHLDRHQITGSMEEQRYLIFDSAAEKYQLMRPGYPEELYQEVFSYCPVNEESLVAEIGIGSGQATMPVLKRGCRLVAIEPGSSFAEICRHRFKEFSGFSLINCRFEDADLPEKGFDMVYCASAFHWVDEKTGYEKVYAILKKGGCFVRFANHPLPAANDLKLAEDIQKLYLDYYYPYVSKKPEYPRGFTERQSIDLAAKAAEYGFTDIRHHLFKRIRTLRAEQYAWLLGTYSDHLSLPEKVRREFFMKIEQVIDDHGGLICVHDTIDLELARKP